MPSDLDPNPGRTWISACQDGKADNELKEEKSHAI